MAKQLELIGSVTHANIQLSAKEIATLVVLVGNTSHRSMVDFTYDPDTGVDKTEVVDHGGLGELYDSLLSTHKEILKKNESLGGNK